MVVGTQNDHLKKVTLVCEENFCNSYSRKWGTLNRVMGQNNFNFEEDNIGLT